MGAQNISVFLWLQRNRHIPLTMRSLLFFSTLFFFFHSSKSDFASKLATFINETPAGYTVSPEVRNGQNCHCRHPAATTILPISSVSTVFTTTTTAPTTTPPAPTYAPTTATDNPTYAPTPATVIVTAPAPAPTYPPLTMGSSALAG